MAVSGRAADRLAAMVIYVALGCVALWVGIALINRSLESKFYKDYLLGWEVALRAYDRQGGGWPRFSGGNHVRYMEEVTRLLRAGGLAPPASNTDRPYVYRLDRIGTPQEDAFLLCFSQRIILYGISPRTFERLDLYVDGKVDPDKGHFRGRPGKDGLTRIGVWNI